MLERLLCPPRHGPQDRLPPPPHEGHAQKTEWLSLQQRALLAHWAWGLSSLRDPQAKPPLRKLPSSPGI